MKVKELPIIEKDNLLVLHMSIGLSNWRLPLLPDSIGLGRVELQKKTLSLP